MRTPTVILAVLALGFLVWAHAPSFRVTGLLHAVRLDVDDARRRLHP